MRYIDSHRFSNAREKAGLGALLFPPGTRRLPPVVRQIDEEGANTMALFVKHILRMPLPWKLWVAALFLTNMGGVFFLPGKEAWVVLGGLFLGALQQNVIFDRLGFVRLLGLGHFHWFAMLTWLLLRLDSIPGETYLHHWVVSVIITCGLSLVIDTVDVVRYLLGERGATIVLEDGSA